RGTLRKLYIKEIQLYPLNSGNTTLKIYDGYNTYSYAISLTGGQLNVFNADNLAGFPFEVNQNSSHVRVVVNQNGISFASAPISCMLGCNGSQPNPCGWADGWNGSQAVKNEGHGM